jgi:hypothetical protein
MGGIGCGTAAASGLENWQSCLAVLLPWSLLVGPTPPACPCPVWPPTPKLLCFGKLRLLPRSCMYCCTHLADHSQLGSECVLPRRRARGDVTTPCGHFPGAASPGRGGTCGPRQPLLLLPSWSGVCSAAVGLGELLVVLCCILQQPGQGDMSGVCVR